MASSSWDVVPHDTSVAREFSCSVGPLLVETTPKSGKGSPRTHLFHEGVDGAANGESTTVTKEKDEETEAEEEPADAELEEMLRRDGRILYKVEDGGGGGKLLKDTYVMGEFLGQGSFGEVRRGVHALTGDEVAIKCIHVSEKNGEHSSSYQKVQREISILRMTRHEHVVALLDTHEEPDEQCLYLVLELVGGGNLAMLIQSNPNGRLDPREARWYFRQLVMGVRHLHQKGIVHRDIKPSNLMLTVDHELKISDFGMAGVVGSFTQDGARCDGGWDGSPMFFAPEIVETNVNKGAGFKADVWAMGVTLYMMVVGKPPFEASTLYELFEDICEAKYELPDFAPADLQHLLGRLLEPDESKRVTIEDICNDPWFCKEERFGFTQAKAQEEQEAKELEPVHPSALMAAVNGMPETEPLKNKLKKNICVLL